MMIIKRIALCACLLATTFLTTGRSEQAPPAAPKLITFRIDVSLTRLQGTRELGTSPYSLLLSYPGNNRSASLRIGVDVPTGTVTNAGSGRTETAFKTIGTQIDTYVSPFDDSRYAVDLSINDTAVFADGVVSDAVRQAQVRRDTAARTFARQQELYKKQLITKDQLARAQAEEMNAEVELLTAQERPKSLAHADQMAFRSFTSQNRVYLHDGESQEMTVATDRTSGETVRASVKLTVVK
jgi:hypothetical protein